VTGHDSLSVLFTRFFSRRRLRNGHTRLSTSGHPVFICRGRDMQTTHTVRRRVRCRFHRSHAGPGLFHRSAPKSVANSTPPIRSRGSRSSPGDCLLFSARELSARALPRRSVRRLLGDFHQQAFTLDDLDELAGRPTTPEIKCCENNCINRATGLNLLGTSTRPRRPSTD
jgi:hypothetical protein